MIEIFGLNSTKYLINKCRVELPINKTAGLNEGFRFIISPEHLLNKRLKLHVIKFHQKEIVLGEATYTQKKRSKEQSVNIRPQVLVNNNRKRTVAVAESYAISVIKSIPLQTR